MEQQSILRLLVIWAVSTFRLTQQYSNDKGPPRAEINSMQEKVNLGQNIKLNCPITGIPTPLYEWYKEGEKIDFTWINYQTKSDDKVLKIRAATLDDAGTIVCKGINGFGKAQVNIELIVIDPLDHNDKNFIPPHFTSETKVAPAQYTRDIGETFSITCEAVGNPSPNIIWLKNGQTLASSGAAKYIHAGKSTVDLVILDASDAGIYTCMAKNQFGSVFHNYSLEVRPPNPMTGSHAGGPLAVVTGVTPANTTLFIGQSSELTCTVKSQERPHIKWFKQVSREADVSSDANINVLNMKDKSYQILPTADDIKVNRNEYINILALTDVTEVDNGTYICFVAKNGLNSLTFKSASVHVVQGPSAVDKDQDSGSFLEATVHQQPPQQGQISIPMMLAIIGLSITSILMLIILATCYIRQKRSPKSSQSGSATGTSESSLPESPEEQHFTHVKPTNHYDIQRQNFMYGGGGGVGQFWNQQSHIYPISQQYPLLQHPQQQLWPQPQHQKVTFRSSSHHDIIEDNDYEVPFGHLIPKTRSQITADRVSSLSSMNLQSHHSDYRDHRDRDHHRDRDRDHQQHFNSFIHHQYMQPQLQRSSSMRPQFYQHVDT